MFGYVRPNDEALTKAQRQRFREVYCGVCHFLRDKVGSGGRLILSFDAAFLALTLCALYEPEEEQKRGKCPSHPLKSHRYVANDYISYAADINVILSYFSALDAKQDGDSPVRQAAEGRLKQAFEAACARFPDKAENIDCALKDLYALEKSGSDDVDALSGCFGRVVGECFAYSDDIWKGDLYQMGQDLGRFIYIMDAWDDVKKDSRRGRFNPFLKEKDAPDFDSRVKSMLDTYIALSAEAFEKLPIVKDADIIRNVLYSGVWTRYAIKAGKTDGENTHD
ncbi:MAG: hypothetical protein IKT23_02255 [Clostridia bacterium]|nr:hypothetical protein [Clostridia bacterium]